MRILSVSVIYFAVVLSGSCWLNAGNLCLSATSSKCIASTVLSSKPPVIYRWQSWREHSVLVYHRFVHSFAALNLPVTIDQMLDDGYQGEMRYRKYDFGRLGDLCLLLSSKLASIMAGLLAFFFLQAWLRLSSFCLIKLASEVFLFLLARFEQQAISCYVQLPGALGDLLCAGPLHLPRRFCSIHTQGRIPNDDL